MNVANDLCPGKALRETRIARGLGLAEAARRAGLSKGSVSKWESGSQIPRGAGLARLLGALEAEPRLRARLLHAADPAFARIELVHTPLGAPVDVGAVIRAMRGRRRTTQADLARAAGVTQATVARWESGDAIPIGENLHAAAFALGASPEEALALACAQGVPSGTLPDAPFGNLEAIKRGFAARLPCGPLYEVMSLGLEAELWPRAIRDARWDAALAHVAAERAVRYFLDGRLGEAEETARRALRLPPTPLVRLAATGAFSALLEVATHGGADPAVLATRIESWAAKLPDGIVKGWMHWEQALRLAEMGRVGEARVLNERMAEGYAIDWDRGDAWLESMRVSGLMEVEIRAGRVDRAEDLIPAYVKEGPQPDLTRRQVRIAHARGKAADEATLQEMREEWRPWSDMDNWYTRHKLAKIEREQARLMARLDG